MLRIEDSGFGYTDLFDHSLDLLQRKTPTEFLGILFALCKDLAGSMAAWPDGESKLKPTNSKFCWCKMFVFLEKLKAK